MEARQDFFAQNPHYGHIFFTSLLQPPDHLLGQIQQVRGRFDDYLAQRYRALLGQIQLRRGVTMEQALDYMMDFQQMFNGYFRQRSQEDGGDLNALIQDHEAKLFHLLDRMLYGIARQGPETD